jgi:uncharacterized protein (TIGR03435 family)
MTIRGRRAGVFVAVMWAGYAAAMAQAPAPGTAASGNMAVVKLPEWDVISVKQPDLQKCQGSGMRYTPDGINVICAPLLFLIQQAYGIMEHSRVIGAPEWVIGGSIWNIDAKLSGDDAATYGKLGREDRNRMLQALLVDRFHLRVHIEQREIQIYDLVIAKGGPKLKEATSEDVASKGGMWTPGSGKIQAVGAQLTSLPWILTNEVERPVVDKTGLAGKYDFTLDYVSTARAATDETGGPSIFTALEEQLGLRLQSAKGPMDVLVIDSVEQPGTN